MLERFRGTIKWFNTQKGFGFIVPDSFTGKAADVFLHITQVQDSKIDPQGLYEGRRVEYSMDIPKSGRKKACAVDIKLID